jgi:glucose/mannose transport system substrate-binding protein
MGPGKKLAAVALLLGSLSLIPVIMRPHPVGAIWTYWRTGAELKAINALMAVSNKQFPDTPIQQRAIAGNVNEMRQALQVGFLGGNPPAAWQSDQGMELKTFVDSGRVACIDDIWKEIDGDHIFPKGVQRVVSVNGKHYGIPLDMHTISNIFYNKKIFAALHLSPPTTWQEFAAVSEAIRKAGYQVLANGSGPTWTLYNLYAPLISTVGVDGYYKLASGQLAFTDPKVREAFQQFTDFYAANYMKNWSGYNWASAADQFVQGKVAMYPMGDWLSAYLKDKGMKPGIDYDFFPAPGLDGATIVQVDVIARAATNNAKKAKAGEHFLLAAASVDGQKAFNSRKGSIAANLMVSDDSYDANGRKTYAEIQASNKRNLVLANLKNLLPVSLGDELGTQISAYAQSPTPQALDRMLQLLEKQRQELLSEKAFIVWQ